MAFRFPRFKTQKHILLLTAMLAIFGANIFFIRERPRESFVCFAENCFWVEVARTDFQKMRGLQFRENLDQNQGMIFLFKNEGKYNFWMKDTKIPLDIIWLDGDKRVVFIKENAQPCKEGSSCPSAVSPGSAKYVLEINGGLAGQMGITPGSQAEFKNIDE